MCVGVGGEPGKTAPTHPPSAGVCFGRAAVRDASAIPCRGALGVRAERGVGTLRRHHPGRYLAGTKAFTACQFRFFRCFFFFFLTQLQWGWLWFRPWRDVIPRAHKKCRSSSGSVTSNITQRAATHHACETPSLFFVRPPSLFFCETPSLFFRPPSFFCETSLFFL